MNPVNAVSQGGVIGSHTHLTGSAIMNQQAEVKRQVMAIIDDVALRKWAIEMAIKCGPSDVKDNTEFFYYFLTNKENTDVKAT